MNCATNLHEYAICLEHENAKDTMDYMYSAGMLDRDTMLAVIAEQHPEADGFYIFGVCCWPEDGMPTTETIAWFQA